MLIRSVLINVCKLINAFIVSIQSHVMWFVNQRTSNLRNKTIKGQMYTKNKTIWQNSFSSFNISLLLPQLALCNISLSKTIYTILSNSLFFSYSYFLARLLLIPRENSFLIYPK